MWLKEFCLKIRLIDPIKVKSEIFSLQCHKICVKSIMSCSTSFFSATPPLFCVYSLPSPFLCFYHILDNPPPLPHPSSYTTAQLNFHSTPGKFSINTFSYFFTRINHYHPSLCFQYVLQQFIAPPPTTTFKYAYIIFFIIFFKYNLTKTFSEFLALKTLIYTFTA